MSCRATPALLLLTIGICAAQSPPSFQSEINLVNVTAVVRSADGKLMRTLVEDDFEISEDGVPQKIRFFARETQLPLTLGVIIDVSGSQEKFASTHKRDIAAFLETVVRPSDRAFAVCFGNRLRLVSDGAGGTPDVIESFARFEKGDRHFPEIGPKLDRDLGTAFYDALFYSLDHNVERQQERRRALVVFSDGEDNASAHDLLEVIEKAQNAGTVVFCIRYTQKKHGQLTARNQYGIRVMQHIASLTGGVDFDALATPLNDVFAQIGEELRAMYQIGYVSSGGPAHDGSFRKVILRCKQPNTTVRAKSGYFAR